MMLVIIIALLFIGQLINIENETTKESLLGRVGFQFHLDKLNKEEFIIRRNHNLENRKRKLKMIIHLLEIFYIFNIF